MPWIVYRAHFQCEQKGPAELKDAGIESYIPLCRRWTKPRRKRSPVAVVSAAFGGYFFGCLPQLEVIRTLHARPLIVADHVATVKDHVIESMRSADEFLVDQAQSRPREKIRRGAAVHLAHSLLGAVDGHMVCDSRGTLATIELENGLRLSLPAEMVRALEAV